MTTSKRRGFLSLSLIFTCLCFSKSLLIKVLNLVSKNIRVCFGPAQRTRYYFIHFFLIGRNKSKNNRYLLVRVFPRLVPVTCICYCSDWFIALSLPVVIGQSVHPTSFLVIRRKGPFEEGKW